MKKFLSVYQKVDDILALIIKYFCAALLMVMIVVCFVNTVGRYAFHHSFRAAEEMAILCAVSCLIIFRFIPYSKETMVALILAFSLPGSYAIPMFGKFEGHRDYVSTTISFSTLVTLLVFVGLTVYINL